jgi:hypothetical protein
MPPGFFYVFANIEYTKMSRLGQKQPYVSYILGVVTLTSYHQKFGKSTNFGSLLFNDLRGIEFHQYNKFGRLLS